MIVPYRCPQCHALLERDTEMAKFMAQLPDDRHGYTCSKCGHLMKASEVQGGQFDVAQSHRESGES